MYIQYTIYIQCISHIYYVYVYINIYINILYIYLQKEGYVFTACWLMKDRLMYGILSVKTLLPKTV